MEYDVPSCPLSTATFASAVFDFVAIASYLLLAAISSVLVESDGSPRPRSLEQRICTLSITCVLTLTLSQGYDQVDKIRVAPSPQNQSKPAKNTSSAGYTKPISLSSSFPPSFLFSLLLAVENDDDDRKNDDGHSHAIILSGRQGE